MQEIFEYLLNSLALLAPIFEGAFLLWTIYGLYSTWRRIANVRLQNFDKVLQSTDLRNLSNYLDNDLGKITLDDYSSSFDAKRRVDAIVKRLVEFVGVEPEITKAKMPQKAKLTEKKRRTKDYPKVFTKVYEDLHRGEIWDSLARLRRMMEIRFRSLVAHNDISMPRKSSVGWLLKELVRREIISDRTYGLFKQALDISNLGVHGFDVSHSDAEKAISNVIEGFGIIEAKKR